MAKEEKDKDAAKAAETKDDRPGCPYCGQKYDVDTCPPVPTQLPIPSAKAKLLAKRQATIDDSIATVEELRLKRMKAVNRVAKSKGLEFRVNLDIETDPREKEHLGEVFFRDPEDQTGKTKIYLGVKAIKEHLDELKALSWELGDAVEKLEEMSNNYKGDLRLIANELGWIHRPIQLDGRGNLVAQSWVNDQIKATEERVRKELQEKKK